MIIKKGQRLKVTIEFDYEAPVYDEDPDDVYELARLEEVDLERGLPEALDYLVQEYDRSILRVTPIIGN